jgi:DNA adenine methylase
MSYIKPFLKYPGNKFRILNKIIPKLIDNSDLRFVDLFCGSCSVFLNTNYKVNILCDINRDLINLYNNLNNLNYINELKEYFIEENNVKEQYLNLRDIFNNSNDDYLRSKLFLYLNRHGFNGLIRFNKNNKFNVPFGLYNNPYFPLKELNYFINKIKNNYNNFVNYDFRESIYFLDQNDIVYVDPPYVPLSKTANFTGYVNNFTLKDQEDLAELIKKLHRDKNVIFVISNHDTEYIRNLYNDADEIESFDVRRNISCDGDNRNLVKELLIIYK